MDLTKCKICGWDLEEMSYGHADRNYERAPYGLDICFDCLKKIKVELDKLQSPDHASEQKDKAL